MDRRKSLKIIGGSAIGIAGLVLADWKWQLVDQMTHKGFFTYHEEKLISSIVDTFIPEGLPPILPNPGAKPIGGLSTGTDKFLYRLFEHCYEKETQEMIKNQLVNLNNMGERELGKPFIKLSQEEREKLLISMENSEIEEEVDFFKLMKSQTIMGFTTVKEVMEEYRGYKVAPGYFKGCVDMPSQA
jgi:hypothetical protein